MLSINSGILDLESSARLMLALMCPLKTRNVRLHRIGLPAAASDATSYCILRADLAAMIALEIHCSIACAASLDLAIFETYRSI